MSSSDAGNRWVAFGLGSLVPLAIVLAVVGLTVHGAIKRAAALQRRTACGRNLAAIGRAGAAYAADHQDAWPDCFTSESHAWYDVGNTRTDRPDPADPGAAPAAPVPGGNDLPAQSNTANLFRLMVMGLGPEQFVCPAADHVADPVNPEMVVANWKAWQAKLAAARETARREAQTRAAARETAPADEAEGERRGPDAVDRLLLGTEAPPDATADRAEEAAEEAAPAPEAEIDAGFMEGPRDFRLERHCSYSFQNVLGSFVLTRDAGPMDTLAVAADASPLRRDVWSGPAEAPKPKKGKKDRPATVPHRVRKGATDIAMEQRRWFVEAEETAPWNEALAADEHGAGLTGPWELNSPNHAFQGQNVLYLDGHVEWTVHPYCGPRWDNLWLRRNPLPRMPDPSKLGSVREFNDTNSYDGETTFDRTRDEGEDGDAKAAGPEGPPSEKKGEAEPPVCIDSWLVP